jgi:hypothetical protein
MIFKVAVRSWPKLLARSQPISVGSFQTREALVDDRRDRLRPPGRGERSHDELLERRVAFGLVERQFGQPFGAELEQRLLVQCRRPRHDQCPFVSAMRR